MVIGVPFKPFLTKGVEKLQCGAVKIFWEPSNVASGGGPATSFQAQLRKEGDDDDDWRNCTTELWSCVFKDLLSDTDYDIRVKAINEKGSSNWTIESVTTSKLIGRCFFSHPLKQHDNNLFVK